MDCLGIDIGGVIVAKVSRDDDTSFFSDNYLNTPEVEGAIETIRYLVENRFGENTHLVSKCGHKVEAKTKEWLNYRSFFSRSGVSATNVHYCRARRDKRPICEALGVSCFIDDRIDVLLSLQSVQSRYLFGSKQRPQAPLVAVRDWREVQEKIAVK